MLFCVVALSMVMVCVSTGLESDMIMVGYPGGVISWVFWVWFVGFLF